MTLFLYAVAVTVISAIGAVAALIIKKRDGEAKNLQKFTPKIPEMLDFVKSCVDYFSTT